MGRVTLRSAVELILKKMTVLQGAIYKFNTIPIKIMKSTLTQIQNNPKIHMEAKRTEKKQSNHREEP